MLKQIAIDIHTFLTPVLDAVADFAADVNIGTDLNERLSYEVSHLIDSLWFPFIDLILYYTPQEEIHGCQIWRSWGPFNTATPSDPALWKCLIMKSTHP